MTGSHYARCKCCGCERGNGVVLSWRGYCGECGPAIREQANDDMHYHRGAYFKHWRRAMAASVGGVLVDDVLDAE
jgi:hypothetical protein